VVIPLTSIPPKSKIPIITSRILFFMVFSPT
jgi:hypothetical protein